MKVNIFDKKLIEVLGKKEVEINFINQNELKNMINTNKSKMFLLKNKEYTIKNLCFCINQGKFFVDPYINKRFDIKELVYINDDKDLFTLIQN